MDAEEESGSKEFLWQGRIGIRQIERKGRNHMKKIVLTATLLGLLTGISFAQRGRAPMSTNRGMTQMEVPSRSQIPGQVVRPNAVQTGPVANRPNGSTASTTTTKQPTAGTPASTVGNDGRVAPPDVHVGPNVGDRKLQH